MADLSQFLNSGGKPYRVAAVYRQILGTNGESFSVSVASNEFAVLYLPSPTDNSTITFGGRSVSSGANNLGFDEVPVKGGLGENVVVTLTATGSCIVQVIVYEEDA